jgi:ABC-type multidrug transport system ATPase subunit
LEKLGLSKKFSDLDNLKVHNSLKSWSIGEKILLITFISLARNPKVFMFDSILDHLDDFLLKDVKEILYDMKKDRTLIISTRNLNLFSDIANKIIFIENGQIQYNGTMDSFMMNFPR